MKKGEKCLRTKMEFLKRDELFNSNNNIKYQLIQTFQYNKYNTNTLSFPNKFSADFYKIFSNRDLISEPLGLITSLQWYSNSD